MKKNSAEVYKRKLDSMDEILHQISLMDQVSKEEELAEIIPALLEALGKYTDAENVYIFEWASEACDKYSNTFEWCREGIETRNKSLQEVPVELMAGWQAAFVKGKAVVISDREQIKEIAPNGYRLMKKQGLQTEIAVPLFASSKLIGFIGLDNPSLDDNVLSMKLLTDVGGHLGSVRENLRLISALEQKQHMLENSIDELEKEKSLLKVLCADYTAVYYCDLEKNSIEVLKTDVSTNDDNTEKYLGRAKNQYSTRIKYYYDHYVKKDESPDFLEKLDPSYLEKQLAEKERVVYQFQVHPNPAGHEFFEMQIAKVENASSDSKIVMGYRSIDEIIQKEKKQQKKIENALAAQILNNEIISAIGKIYWMIYRMDLQKDTYEEVSCGDTVHSLTGKNGKSSSRFGKEGLKMIAPEYRNIMQTFLDTSTLTERLRNKETISQEYLSLRGNWHLARFIVKKRSAEGKVTNVLYVVREINEQKQVEFEYQRQLMETAEEAKRANIAKTDFLRRMSHDIRTPINGIRGIVDIGDHSPTDIEKQKECRAKVKIASGYLLELVNNILDMNKLESGEIRLEKKSFDLKKILQKSDEIIEVQGREYGISYSSDYKNIQHRYLKGSPVHLRQILLNILGNSVKYNRENGFIKVSCKEIKQQGEYATFEWICEDNGYGMSEEFQEHLFEPFAQENTEARTKYAGTGLGLAITKELIECMGGSISFNSEQDKGTTFYITLTFKIDSEKMDLKKEKSNTKDVSLSGKRALLVEDNDMNMEIAEFLLQNEGMIVTKAWNGQEAVEIFRNSSQWDFDMIFMDVMMPKMNGIEATKIIRSMNRSDAKNIPIFAMTANAFIDDEERSKAAGMNEHFTKPLDMRKICSTIKKYCSNK